MVHQPIRKSAPNRRELLCVTAAGLTAMATGSGCGEGAEATRSSDAGSPEQDAATDGGDASALPPTCGEQAEVNIEGPFFTPGSPQRRNLREPQTPGVPLSVVGRVLSPECRPLAGALLDFWQADDAGMYGTKLRGHQFSNADGMFQLDTIVPGRYLNGATYRPAHLHVKVGIKGFMMLTTQLYFPGDPYNATDPFIRDGLIMQVDTTQTALVAATFDFILARG